MSVALFFKGRVCKLRKGSYFSLFFTRFKPKYPTSSFQSHSHKTTLTSIEWRGRVHAGRQIDRQPIQSIVRVSLNDWSCLLQYCNAHRCRTDFILPSNLYIYSSLSRREVTFVKHEKKCFSTTLLALPLSGSLIELGGVWL